jgi:hypothetical protein
VWCSLEENPAAAIAHGVLSRMFEDNAPQFLRLPFGSGDARALHALAEQAGFPSVTVERVELWGRSGSPRAVADGFAKGSPLALDLTAMGADLDAVAAAFEEALRGHGGAPFRSPLAALVLAAS